ncbi:MAG: GTPase ObgE [Flavobacteriaceae bacterium]
MTEGNFVDYVKLSLTSGNGGKGSVHLHREKYITKGGPDGGDGGRGGHVILRANPNLWTLYTFKFKKHFSAEHGGHGSKNRSSGAQGEDIYIDVPLGTVIKDTQTEEVICEITEKGQEVIVVKGGLGGRGNWHFKSSTRQTPRYAQPGIKGEERLVTLELKLLADVGLVGFPNAGKSTLLAALTSAKPKIADYEFTTLKPNLGIVHYRDFRSFVMADIPGIIEGAAQGKGLGHYFLRHIERNSVLLYVIPADTKDVKKEFEILRRELQEFNPELLDKQYMIVLSKCDLLDEELKEAYALEMKQSFSNIPHTMISSVSQLNLQALKDELWEVLALENSTV